MSGGLGFPPPRVEDREDGGSKEGLTAQLLSAAAAKLDVERKQGRDQRESRDGDERVEDEPFQR